MLSFTGDALAQDLYVVGIPVLELSHSCDNPHNDLFVRVSEVDAKGRSRNVSDGYRRGTPTSGTVTIELDAVAHRFRAGSRIRVLVAGGSHPRFTRNLGTGEPLVSGSRLAAATHTVHVGDGASRLRLPAGQRLLDSAKSGVAVNFQCHTRGVDASRVRYARNGDVHLAYRTLGNGEIPLVMVPGWVSNVDLYDDPAYLFAPFIEQLAHQTTLVLWDKRGTGLSDPTHRVPTLDERMDDLHAVLDAAGVDCPALLGVSEGGPMSLLFAATFPDRVRSMVLYGTAARFTRDLPDFPWGWEADWFRRNGIEAFEKHWGEGVSANIMLNDAAKTPGVREMIGRYERASASPAMAAMLATALGEIDVRDILPTVPTRTLVLCRPGDQLVSVEAAEALARAMPRCRVPAIA